jgi:hypothetical protein
MRFLFSMMLFAAASLQAQVDPDCYVTNEFLIAGSHTDYPSALKQAKKVATASGYELDLRGLKPAAGTGLSFDDSSCIEDFREAPPCYIARGRFDDGVYVSVEYSTAYEGFRPGYYIVVAASANVGNTIVAPALAKVRRIVPSAYVKKSKVYMCCMH